MAGGRKAVVCVLVLAECFGTAAGAQAQAPAQTDVLLLFDTTGSMDGALDEAKAKIVDVADGVAARLPDSQFAVAEVRDYEDPYGDVGDLPWRLVQPVTADRGRLTSAVDQLF